jgi:hypothetical protein
VNHGRPARIFYLAQTYEWFSMHDKERNPYHVNRRITISIDDMNNAYKDRLEKLQHACRLMGDIIGELDIKAVRGKEEA